VSFRDFTLQRKVRVNFRWNILEM